MTGRRTEQVAGSVFPYILGEGSFSAFSGGFPLHFRGRPFPAISGSLPPHFRGRLSPPSFLVNGLAFDIFRFDEDGKIAEHWDVMETIADRETWANENGKF